MNHSASITHQKARKSVYGTQFLQTLYPSNSSDENISADRTVDLPTRKCRADALITSFLAEHSLPFSIAPEILELSKTLSKDLTALNSLQMSRVSASYKLKFGLAKTVKDQQIETLKNVSFSLNVDESTNKALQSVLTMLVQYYCEDEEKVILRHLASVNLQACTSDNIFQAIVSVIEENDIPWKNLTSLLMDSCNTMRGVKNGVEVQIRTKKAPHLLDIDGDTCHTVNNCAKKFCEPFLKHIEILCDNIYFDLKSADKRELFFEMCEILGVKPLKPLSRPDHRWLYVLIVLERIECLWDALVMFYFSWLSKDDTNIFKDDITAITAKRELSVSQIEKVNGIQSQLKKKSMTEDGKNRKQRIAVRLFEQKKKTLLHMGIYKAVLTHFNSYLKLFQTRNVFCLHLLHSELYQLTKLFFTFFINHDLISEAETVDSLLKIDVLSSDSYLPDSLIFCGSDASKIIKDSKKKDLNIKEFRTTLKTAYSRCAAYMLKKLPLKNSCFIKFSGLDPDLRGTTSTFLALAKLGESLPNIISEDDSSSLDTEIRLYQIDSSLSTLTEDKSVEKFWVALFKAKASDGLLKYTYLSKLIKAVVTCFHGPHVEGAFNLMDNIMTSTRTSLNNTGLDAIQTVKYFLMSKKATTCEVFGSKDPTHEPIDKTFGINLIKSRSQYQLYLDTKISTAESDEVVKTNAVNKPNSSSISSPVQSSSSLDTCATLTVKRPHSPDAKKTKQTKIASFFRK